MTEPKTDQPEMLEVPEPNLALLDAMKELVDKHWPEHKMDGTGDPGAALVSVLMERQVQAGTIAEVLASAIGYFAGMVEKHFESEDGKEPPAAEQVLLDLVSESYEKVNAFRQATFMQMVLETLNEQIDCDCPNCKPENYPAPDGATLQ